MADDEAGRRCTARYGCGQLSRALCRQLTSRLPWLLERHGRAEAEPAPPRASCKGRHARCAPRTVPGRRAAAGKPSHCRGVVARAESRQGGQRRKAGPRRGFDGSLGRLAGAAQASYAGSPRWLATSRRAGRGRAETSGGFGPATPAKSNQPEKNTWERNELVGPNVIGTKKRKRMGRELVHVGWTCPWTVVFFISFFLLLFIYFEIPFSFLFFT
jgi:hypothetical protein